MTIPNNLFLFWHDLKKCPDIVSSAIESTIKTYSKYEVTIADDNYMKSFISRYYGPQELELFTLNQIPASRSDLARLILLHHFGGIYIDASMAFHHEINLSKYLHDEVVFIKRDKQKHPLPGSLHIINGIIIARKKSSFLRKLIQNAFLNLSEGTYNYNVSWATGPKLLTLTLQKWNKFQDHEVSIISFSELKENHLIHNRDKGVVTSTWLVQQQDGIINIDYYSKEQQKRWGDYPGYVNRVPVSIF